MRVRAIGQSIRDSLAMLSLVVLLGSASAAEAGGRVALVVANAAYDAAPLGNPKVDLALVVPELEGLGFDVTPVTDADLQTFDNALADFALKAKDADVALFYFAGHGFAVNDGLTVRNYLMSTSADVTSTSDRVIRAGGIALDEIIAQLEGARTALIFVDACRNDPRAKRGNSSRGLAAIDGGHDGSIFVGLSTRVGDTAADGAPGKGSPFARAFVANIGAPNLRVDDAFTRIRLAVEQETRFQQRPDVGLYELDEPVVLHAETASEPPQTRTGTADDARSIWDSVKDSTSIAMLESFATSFPDTIYSRFARARIDELREIAAAQLAKTDTADTTPVGQSSPEPGNLAQQSAAIDKSTDIVDLDSSSGHSLVLPCADLSQVKGGFFLGCPLPPNPASSRDLCDTLASTAEGMYVDFFEIDTPRAIAACQEAAKAYPSEPRFSFELGRAFHAGDEYRQAFAAYRQAAEDGFPEAMTMVGSFYAEGIVETQNCMAAQNWLTKAVRAGDASRALRDLSLLFGNCPEIADSNRATQFLFLSLLYGNDETRDEIRTGANFKDRATISRLQTFLKQHGFYAGGIDGRMGRGTEAAVEAAYRSKYGAPTLEADDAAVFEDLLAQN